MSIKPPFCEKVKNKSCGDYSTTDGEKVAIPGVERPPVRRVQLFGEGRFHKEGSAFRDPSIRVDKARNPGVRGAGERDPVFDRPEDDHGKMLIRGGGVSKPSVVG